MRMLDVKLIARTYGPVRVEDPASPMRVRPAGMSMADYLAARRELFGSEDEPVPETVRDPSALET
jgi:hypothetical protein